MRYRDTAAAAKWSHIGLYTFTELEKCSSNNKRVENSASIIASHKTLFLVTRCCHPSCEIYGRVYYSSFLYAYIIRCSIMSQISIKYNYIMLYGLYYAFAKLRFDGTGPEYKTSISAYLSSGILAYLSKPN